MRVGINSAPLDPGVKGLLCSIRTRQTRFQLKESFSEDGIQCMIFGWCCLNQYCQRWSLRDRCVYSLTPGTSLRW